MGPIGAWGGYLPMGALGLYAAYQHTRHGLSALDRLRAEGGELDRYENKMKREVRNTEARKTLGARPRKTVIKKKHRQVKTLSVLTFSGVSVPGADYAYGQVPGIVRGTGLSNRSTDTIRLLGMRYRGVYTRDLTQASSNTVRVAFVLLKHLPANTSPALTYFFESSSILSMYNSSMRGNFIVLCDRVIPEEADPSMVYAQLNGTTTSSLAYSKYSYFQGFLDLFAVQKYSGSTANDIVHGSVWCMLWTTSSITALNLNCEWEFVDE